MCYDAEGTTLNYIYRSSSIEKLINGTGISIKNVEFSNRMVSIDHEVSHFEN